MIKGGSKYQSLSSDLSRCMGQTHRLSWRESLDRLQSGGRVQQPSSRVPVSRLGMEGGSSASHDRAGKT